MVLQHLPLSETLRQTIFASKYFLFSFYIVYGHQLPILLHQPLSQPITGWDHHIWLFYFLETFFIDLLPIT